MILFRDVIYDCLQQARVFDPGRAFQPSVITEMCKYLGD